MARQLPFNNTRSQSFNILTTELKTPKLITPIATSKFKFIPDLLGRLSDGLKIEHVVTDQYSGSDPD